MRLQRRFQVGVSLGSRAFGVSLIILVVLLLLNGSKREEGDKEIQKTELPKIPGLEEMMLTNQHEQQSNGHTGISYGEDWEV
jgi:hypothetical protein